MAPRWRSVTASRRARWVASLGALCVVCGSAPAQAAPTWLSPLPLSEAGRHAGSPDVAVDAEGNVIAVWEGSDGIDRRAYAAVRPAGGAFGDPQTLSEAGQGVNGLDLAVNPSGVAVVVWSRSDGTKVRIQAATRQPGATFGPPETISAAGQSAHGPSVAVDASGRAVVAWYRQDGTSGSCCSRVQTARQGPGGSFEAPRTLSAAGQSAFSPQVAQDEAGNVLVVWHRADASGGCCLRVQAIARAADDDFGSGQLVQTLSEPGQNASRPRIAVAPDGEATVVWTRNDGANLRVQAAARSAAAAAGTPGFLPPVDLSAAGEEAMSPHAAIDPGGNAVAVWTRHDGVVDRVQAAARPRGGSFGPPQTISAAGSESSQPHVALGPEGEALAVWQTEGGTSSRIQAAIRPPGGGFGPDESISAANQSASGPRVVRDSAGNAAAVWSRFEASGDTCCHRVDVAGYDAAAPVLRDLRVPSTGVAGEALGFSVASSDVWSPVQTTWSFGDGAGAQGTNVAHAFAGAGTFAPRVTATDAVGNASTFEGSVTIGPAPPGGGGSSGTVGDRVAPTVSRFGMSRRRFGVARRATPLIARTRRGSAFRYVLSEPAAVRIVIARRTPGRRVGRRCRKPARGLGGRRSCVRHVRVGTLVRAGRPAGAGVTRFSGRIGRLALRRSRYRATITAVDAAGNRSAPRRTTFRVVSG